MPRLQNMFTSISNLLLDILLLTLHEILTFVLMENVLFIPLELENLLECTIIEAHVIASASTLPFVLKVSF